MLMNFGLISAQISFEDSMAIFFKGESEKINKENLNDIYDAIYDMYSQYNAINKEKYLTESLKENLINYKTSLSSSINEKSLIVFEQNATLKLVKDSIQSLIVLESKLPIDIEERDPLNSVSITIKENKLLNKNITKIRINENNTSNFGTFVDYKNINGIKKEQKYKTIEIKNVIDKKVEMLTGSLIYNIKILTDYSKIKINKTDFGKTFNLNNKNITFINSSNNMIIIDGIRFDDTFDINAINLDKKENVIKSPSTGKYPIYKDVYNTYLKNPKITKEELKKELPLDKLQKMNVNGYYIAILNDFPFLNNFILFSRVYGISKNIEVKI